MLSPKGDVGDDQADPEGGVKHAISLESLHPQKIPKSSSPLKSIVSYLAPILTDSSDQILMYRLSGTNFAVLLNSILDSGFFLHLIGKIC